MSWKLDSFNASTLRDFKESKLGERDALAAPPDFPFDPGDFTPIVFIITNAVGQGTDVGFRGYQVPEHLERDLNTLQNVMDIFNARTLDDWANVGRIKPNIRVLLLQPMFTGIEGWQPDNVHFLDYSGGVSMLPLVPSISGLPILYVKEQLPALGFQQARNFPSAAAPGRPGGGLRSAWNALSRNGVDKLQPRWTPEQLEFLNTPQQFVMSTDIGFGEQDESRERWEPDDPNRGDPNKGPFFPGLYWQDKNLSNGDWIADWILTNFGVLPDFRPAEGSTIDGLEKIVIAQNPRVFDEEGVFNIEHNTFTWEWIRRLAVRVQGLI